MAGVRHISVALTDEQLSDIEAAVTSGAYASTGEVVQEAITDWRLGHALRGEDIQLLRELWDEGNAGGVTRPFDVERTIAAVRARRGKVAAE